MHTITYMASTCHYKKADALAANLHVLQNNTLSRAAGNSRSLHTAAVMSCYCRSKMVEGWGTHTVRF